MSSQSTCCPPPNVPEPIPQSVGTFLARYATHDREHEIGINVTQRLESGEQGALLLDIDVFKTGPFDPDDMGEIKRAFEALREMKNRVFFNMVTERCLQLFQ